MKIRVLLIRFNHHCEFRETPMVKTTTRKKTPQKQGLFFI